MPAHSTYSPKKLKDGTFDIINDLTGKKVGHARSEASAKRIIRFKLAWDHGWRPKDYVPHKRKH